MPLSTGLPLVTSGVAMLMDLRTARVENTWLVFMAAVSFVTQLYCAGWTSLRTMIPGMLCPFLLLIGLYYFRMLGPGDIKLLCVLGSMVGAGKILTGLVVSFLIGGGLSFAVLLLDGNYRERIHYFLTYIRNYICTGEVRPYYKTGMALENIHFTVPIFLSMLLYAGGVF
jgi:prepilin peptidase CpaA